MQEREGWIVHVVILKGLHRSASQDKRDGRLVCVGKKLHTYGAGGDGGVATGRKMTVDISCYFAIKRKIIIVCDLFGVYIYLTRTFKFTSLAYTASS